LRRGFSRLAADVTINPKTAFATRLTPQVHPVPIKKSLTDDFVLISSLSIRRVNALAPAGQIFAGFAHKVFYSNSTIPGWEGNALAL
jgi:hypothetical protein